MEFEDGPKCGEREMNEVSLLRILLIDDDEDSFVTTRKLLSKALNRTCDVEWASTYEAGLRALRLGEHEVCLLDYRLGARDGLDLLREAVAEGSTATILMVTGQGTDRVDHVAMQAGAADFLVKEELTPSLLERSIRHAHERHRLLRALQRSNKDLEQLAYVASHDM